MGDESGIKAGIDPPGIAFIDVVAVLRADGGGFDVAAGIVVMKAGFRVDATHRADHFGGEQHVFHRNNLGQQINARLMIDTGIEENVVKQVFGQ